MPLVVKDRVKETTTTTGTGAVTLAGPAAGFQSFSVIGNGNTTYYAIVGGTEWEVGIGTYSTTGPTLTRDTVLESSNSGSPVNFSAGTKDVFVTYPAEKSISDGYGTLPVTNGGTGANTLTSGYLVKGNGTSAVSASSVYDNGSSVSIGSTSSGSSKFYVYDANASISTNEVAAGGTGVASSRLKYSTNHYGIYVGSVNAMVFYDYGASAERMRIDNVGNVLVAATTASYSSANRGNITIGGGAGGSILSLQISGVDKGYLFHDGTNLQLLNNANGASIFYTNAAERMRLDASGNLGLGVTPSAWSSGGSLELAGGKVISFASAFSNIATNAYYNGGFKYTTTAAATLYAQSVGQHQWHTAPSGTAGTAISFTQAMTLDASGNLGIGTASPSFKLDVQSASAVTSRVYCTDATGTSYAAVTAGTASGVNSVMYSYSGAGWYGTTTNHPMLFMTNNTERMRIDSSGNVGIGTSSPAARTHIVNSTLNAQLRLQDVTTDATNKYGVIGTGHYTNAQSPILAVGVGSLSASSTVYIGGGFGTLNAATAIQFYTAANNTTTTGTEQFRIASNGAWGLSGANYGTSGQVLTSNGSGSAPSWQAVSSKYELISTTTASGATSLDFTNLSTTYSEYIIISRNFIATNNTAINVRTSTNNGTSYDSGANNYVLTQMRVDTGGTISGFTTQFTEIQTGFTWTTNPNYFRLHLVNAGVSTYPIVETTIGLTVPNAQHARTIGWRQSTTAINAMRVFPSAGTISGTFYLYGVRT